MLSRRNFLNGTVGAGLAPAAQGAQPASPRRPPLSPRVST
jgi:hypothetical protein